MVVLASGQLQQAEWQLHMLTALAPFRSLCSAPVQWEMLLQSADALQAWANDSSDGLRAAIWLSTVLLLCPVGQIDG